MKHNRLSILFFAAIMIFSCEMIKTDEAPNDDNKDPLAIAREEGKVVINGVERTELALLMRKMHDELAKVKDSLEAGYTVNTNFSEEFERIKYAHATEPEKIDEVYQHMADAFIDNYAAFEISKGNQKEAFNIMLDNCMVCHQQKCPGPIKAIKKLKIQA